jgi:hypothetical protein
VVALPALASTSDPIFALIEKHRASRAEMNASSDARDEIEDERFGGRFTPGYEEWMARMEAHPDYRTAVERGAAATIAEEAAFLALLRAAATASPDGRTAIARYVCDLTREREGHAIEGAEYPYRVLAAFAGLPVTGDDPGAFED